MSLANVPALTSEIQERSDIDCDFRAPEERPRLAALALAPPACQMELHGALCNTKLVTQRLKELVPLLNFINFQCDRISPERTILSVPLLETAMNQNGTHQASVFYILADYTLGIGMFAALFGYYVIGVHDRCDAVPIQFWLKSGSVEHRAPGNGAMRAEVSIPEDVAEKMRACMVAKGRCELSVPVNIYRGDVQCAVANHVMVAFADLPQRGSAKKSIVQIQKQKLSALMIAGLRGDAISTSLADEQGVAIARRMQRATPQLPALVAARTTHVAKSLGAPDRGFTQVVVLGAGLDAKSMRFAGAAQRWFLCDLPDMLQYRAERYNALGYADRHCVHVAIDFRRGGWAQQIIDAGFNPGAPALVILEGVSMYLPAAELRATADEIRKLCNNVESRWWFDHVTREAFTLEQPEVLSFLSNMARLGEPFITGISNPAQILGEDSWRLAHSSPHFGSHEHVAELGCL